MLSVTMPEAYWLATAGLCAAFAGCAWAIGAIYGWDRYARRHTCTELEEAGLKPPPPPKLVHIDQLALLDDALAVAERQMTAQEAIREVRAIEAEVWAADQEWWAWE